MNVDDLIFGNIETLESYWWLFLLVLLIPGAGIGLLLNKKNKILKFYGSSNIDDELVVDIQKNSLIVMFGFNQFLVMLSLISFMAIDYFGGETGLGFSSKIAITMTVGLILSALFYVVYDYDILGSKKQPLKIPIPKLKIFISSIIGAFVVGFMNFYGMSNEPISFASNNLIWILFSTIYFDYWYSNWLFQEMIAD